MSVLSNYNGCLNTQLMLLLENTGYLQHNVIFNPQVCFSRYSFDIRKGFDTLCLDTE